MGRKLTAQRKNPARRQRPNRKRVDSSQRTEGVRCSSQSSSKLFIHTLARLPHPSVLPPPVFFPRSQGTKYLQPVARQRGTFVNCLGKIHVHFPGLSACGFPSHARIWGEGSTNHSQPMPLSFFLSFLK